MIKVGQENYNVALIYTLPYIWMKSVAFNSLENTRMKIISASS